MGGGFIKNRKTAGFTLVELLIAVFVFAVLSVVGSLILRQFVKHQDRIEDRIQTVNDQAMAYRYMQRDFAQALNAQRTNPWLRFTFIFDMLVSGHESRARAMAQEQHWGQPRLLFHVVGTPDIPSDGIHARIASVGYYLKGEEWVRLYMRDGDQAPQIFSLLKGVEDVKTEVVMPDNRLLKTLEASARDQSRVPLPRAVWVHLKLKNRGWVDWLLTTPASTHPIG